MAPREKVLNLSPFSRFYTLNFWLDRQDDFLYFGILHHDFLMNLYAFSVFCLALSRLTTLISVVFVRRKWRNVIKFCDLNVQSVKVCDLSLFICNLKKIKAYKMKPLQTNKRMLIWLCMCSPNSKDTNVWKKVSHIAFSLMIFVFNLWVVIAHLAYFWTYRSTHLDESLFALTNATAFSVVMYSMIYAFFTRRRTRRIFKNLWKIYNARAYL